MNFNYAKYKGLIIGITAFLFLEVTILTTNYAVSFEISKDAEAVNIAGRQRMLSQRITKALIDSQNFINTQSNRSTEELKKASNLFDNTLAAFKQGGDVIGADNNATLIPPVSSEKSIVAVDQGLSIWKQYKQLIDTAIIQIQNRDKTQDLALQEAIDYGRENNLGLLKLMNDLTVDLEGVASSKATRLQLIQTVGLGLTVLVFLILIFYSLRHLQRSDAVIVEQQKQNKRILETVDEGLFLVDDQLIISDQQSTKMQDIFSREDTKGEDLLEFLDDYISQKDKQTTKEYFDLLFDERKPEKLISDLNPLQQVSIQVADGNLGFIKKSLKFTFKRVIEGGSIRRILTTISDITVEVKLKEELAKAEKSQSEQMNLLSVIVNADQLAISSFIKSASKNFKEINQVLKGHTESINELKSKAQSLITSMHKVKGDASALSIDILSTLAHDFENEAQLLTEKPNLGGEDFIPLTVILEKMISYNETINGLYQKIFPQHIVVRSQTEDMQAIEKPNKSIKEQWKPLYDLTESVANRQQKSVEFVSSGLNDYSLPEKLKNYINTAAIQLIRNSINHGIETPQERENINKDSTGLLSLNLYQFKDNSYELVFKDDGKGIQEKALITRALETGIIQEEQIKQLSKKQILSLMFHPGLSTTAEIDEDSGRGVGMSLLSQMTQKIGGKINIQTANNIGTTFKIKIPASIMEIAKQVTTSNEEVLNEASPTVKELA